MTDSLSAEIDYVSFGSDDDGWQRDEWDITLHYQGRTMQTKFYTGTLHGEPTIDDVMESLFSDAQGVEYDGFYDWAESYGFDTDSRKAERTYLLIVEQTDRLKAFCGDDFEAMQNEAFAEING